MKEIAIISDGTPGGTTLYFDGEEVSNISSIEFKCVATDDFIDFKVGYIPFSHKELATAEELVAGIKAALEKDKKNEILTKDVQGPDQEVAGEGT